MIKAFNEIARRKHKQSQLILSPFSFLVVCFCPPFLYNFKRCQNTVQIWIVQTWLPDKYGNELQWVEDKCCIFWPAFGAHSLFNVFGAKKLEKEEIARNLSQNLAKKNSLVCIGTLVRCLMPRKNLFLVVKTCFYCSRPLGYGTRLNLHSFLMLFLPFFSFCTKTLKKHISSSVWSVQHPNTGWNIQQISTIFRPVMAQLFKS